MRKLLGLLAFAGMPCYLTAGVLANDTPAALGVQVQAPPAAPAGPVFRLPPLAVPDPAVAALGPDTGAGSLAGTLAMADADFAKSLSAQGWARQDAIALGGARRQSLLSTWLRADGRLTVLLWEQGAGRCGYSWGFDTESTDALEEADRP